MFQNKLPLPCVCSSSILIRFSSRLLTLSHTLLVYMHTVTHLYIHYTFSFSTLSSPPLILNLSFTHTYLYLQLHTHTPMHTIAFWINNSSHVSYSLSLASHIVLEKVVDKHLFHLSDLLTYRWVWEAESELMWRTVTFFLPLWKRGSHKAIRHVGRGPSGAPLINTSKLLISKPLLIRNTRLINDPLAISH